MIINIIYVFRWIIIIIIVVVNIIHNTIPYENNTTITEIVIEHIDSCLNTWITNPSCSI